MPRLLIIDADSMLGRHCCADFERAGWSVLGTSAQPKPGSGLVPCTVTSSADIDSVVSILSPDAIVNCAQADPVDPPDFAYRTHVGGSLNVLAAAAKHRPGIPVLLVGCGSEYGSGVAMPAFEAAMANPDCLFAASKLAQTQAAIITAQEHRLPVITIRPFAIVGRGLPPNSAIGRLFGRVRRTLLESPDDFEFDVAGALAACDLIDVRDVARAIRLLLEKAVPEPGHAEVYNIATQLGTRLLDVASILGRQARLKAQPAGGRPDGWLVPGVGSFAKLRKATGWSPEFTWRQSLTEICRPAADVAQV